MIFKRLYISTLLPKTFNRKQISDRFVLPLFLKTVGDLIQVQTWLDSLSADFSLSIDFQTNSS